MGRAASSPRMCAHMLGLADRTRLLDLFETLMAGKAGEALGRIARALRRRLGPRADHRRSRRYRASRDAAENPARGRQGRLALGSRAAARPLLRRAPVDAGAVARLADPVARPSRGAGRRKADRGGRDAADPPRLRGQFADARRGAEGALAAATAPSSTAPPGASAGPGADAAAASPANSAAGAVPGPLGDPPSAATERPATRPATNLRVASSPPARAPCAARGRRAPEARGAAPRSLRGRDRARSREARPQP